MTKQDVCIIWGSTQDVAKNKSKWGLRRLMNFAGKHRNTNIILMDVPHGHDLEMKSCVNKEIKAFNRKLRNLSERTVNLPVSDVSTNTEIYTRHGLHMNRRGKGQTAEKTATETRTLFILNKEVPIVLQWKRGN